MVGSHVDPDGIACPALENVLLHEPGDPTQSSLRTVGDWSHAPVDYAQSSSASGAFPQSCRCDSCKTDAVRHPTVKHIAMPMHPRILHRLIYRGRTRIVPDRTLTQNLQLSLVSGGREGPSPYGGRPGFCGENLGRNFPIPRAAIYSCR